MLLLVLQFVCWTMRISAGQQTLQLLNLILTRIPIEFLLDGSSSVVCNFLDHASFCRGYDRSYFHFPRNPIHDRDSWRVFN